MYASQFDGTAAFSGGGFMPSQATQTLDTNFSSAKNRDNQGLLPLTVKQISEAPLSNDDKSNIVIDGVDVNNVTMIGMVLNKAERVTDIAFTLDDGTGRIECHRWVNEAVDSKEMEGIQDGMYVQIHGHLKSFQGKRKLNAFSVRPVTDFNEITCHFLECIYVHLYNTKVKANMMSSVMNTPLQNVSKGHQAATPNQFSGQFGIDGLKGIDQKVLDYLQQPSNLGREKGVHRDELAQQLKVPLEKIMESIRSLEEEGLIYSTIDECHYKSTGNG
ncbi:replication protein A 32 kDa subunit A-like isoform X2 [Macadamia integrifolia]|uniref:replication protein A 32 kDa subunit A-like isoform X2 n=1 Tax=Macadamia integrifolia TaxID=60698 RepID=UPI001C4FBA99|nr:replication protein A 32 kDa subunit A-like isoform X2 [Macadamia integrifolia]